MKNTKIKIAGETINISAGNSKMGHVESFSLPAIVTCAAGIPCAKTCYAAKFYEVVKSCYRDNLHAVQVLPVEVIAGAIADHINKRGVRLFRWNVSGDFAAGGKFNAKYWDIACEVARRCPGTLFLAFTKVYECFNHERPANFNVVASVWGDYRPDDISQIPTAHFNDGTISMPENAMECSGECESCMLCFGLRNGEAVYFNKH